MSPITRQRHLLVLLAVLFFAPLGLSFYLYYSHSSLAPANHVNHGLLIQPVRPVPLASFPLLQNRWTLLYANAGACAEACREKLHATRQVRIALDRDMVRVQRVLIADADCCDPQFLQTEHPDLILLHSADAAPLLALLPQGTGYLYIVDPLGNLMMSYATDAASKGLLEDLKRLLKLSHVG